MPGFDGTGPLGFGPMTGRATGYCVGFPITGYAPTQYVPGLPPYGYGVGYGYAPRYVLGWGQAPGWFGPGWGRGFGRRFGRGGGRGRRWFGW